MKTKGKFLSIKWKLIFTILPVVLIMFILLSVIVSTISKNAIIATSDEKMTATLGKYTNEISNDLEKIKAQADELSLFIAATHNTAKIDEYSSTLSAIVVNNDMILGAGLWFEPNVYDKEETYYGPYWYKNVVDGKWDGKDLIETWDYSNAEYDYFNQEYYINAKNSTSATITNPYYDETSGLVMASCSAPIIDREGKFYGCVTIDLMLTSVNEKLGSIKIGDTGTVWLIDGAGNYVYHPAFENAAAEGLNITSSTEMGEYLAKVQNEESGIGNFKWENKTRLLYWQQLPGSDWKMGLTIEENEVIKSVNTMINISIVICILAIILCSAVIIFQAVGIAKVINKVKDFATTLASGDFTIKKLDVKRNDEIGIMANALNNMYENNSNVIKNIGDGSNKVAVSSNTLSETSNDLLRRFEEIKEAINKVNDAMTSTGAATQEVSASANEVNNSVEKLAEETLKTKQEVVAIKEKAADIERKGEESSKNALRISQQRGKEVEEAAQRAQVVEQISVLAESISSIAFQINLLSLNASIEAARAGEHGKGFSVVASEISKLADETKNAVEEIQNTIEEIQSAFGDLKDASLSLIDFMNETVAPDYENFIKVGQEYGKDAQSFGDLSEKISEMVSYISESMEQVNEAVASIAENATETASSSSEVADNVSESSELMEKVNAMVNDNKGVSENLDGIVKQFKFEENIKESVSDINI